MTAFDFDAARRWARFDPQRTRARRGDGELPFVTAGRMGGQALLLDTCVYIDQMQDRSPRVLDDLVAQRQVNHSTVAIQELMHTVGALNPSDPRTATAIDEIGKQIKAMPPHRLFAPDGETLGRPPCCPESCAACKDTRKTAGCAHCWIAYCSSRPRSLAWSC